MIFLVTIKFDEESVQNVPKQGIMSNMSYLSTPWQVILSEMYNIAIFQTYLRVYAFPSYKQV